MRKKRKRPHGSGSLLRRGARWIAQWTGVDGKRRTRSCPSEEAARQLLAETAANVRIDVRTQNRTLTSLARDWLESRAQMASSYDDGLRWKNHWAPEVGGMLPDQVDVLVLKRCIRTFRAKGLSKTTVKLLISLLSSLYGDLVEDGAAALNPTRMLSKKTRRNELRPDHDPKKVPFTQNPADVPRIYHRLLDQNPSVAVAYAIGATCGLRTGEVRSLDWTHIDLDRRVIHVQVQAERRPAPGSNGTSTPKDDDSRFVPLPDSLLPILRAQLARTGGAGLVCPPLYAGTVQESRGERIRFLGEHLLGKALKGALRELGLPELIWYNATRHTFASHWVLRGGTLERLQEIMGHSSVAVTERYAHLMPGQFTDADRGRVPMDFSLAGTVEITAAVN